MREFKPFDPLDRPNLAASAAEALLETTPEPLGSMVPFLGVGVYAIYYTGDYAPYRAIRDANINDQWLAPIYVGKAIPKGGRIGVMKDGGPPGRELMNRLRNHEKSVRAASSTLSIDDFHARFLVVSDIFIPLIESLMISRLAPLWNTSVSGFGSNAPGGGREKGMRSRWDTLHPGRPSARNLKDRPETQAEIAREATALLASRPTPSQSLLKP